MARWSGEGSPAARCRLARECWGRQLWAQPPAARRAGPGRRARRPCSRPVAPPALCPSSPGLGIVNRG
eukprot:2519800-Pyramimonas_sp.AAC.1